MNSATAQSSVPLTGDVPLRCSSQLNTPLGWAVMRHQVFDAEARSHAVPEFARLDVKDAAGFDAHGIVGTMGHHPMSPLFQWQDMAQAVIRLKIGPVERAVDEQISKVQQEAVAGEVIGQWTASTLSIARAQPHR